MALTLRQCKARYRWEQRELPTHFSHPEIDRIEPYNSKAEGPPGRPAKVLFGPLFKLVEEKHILLRKGVVLFN